MMTKLRFSLLAAAAMTMCASGKFGLHATT